MNAGVVSKFKWFWAWQDQQEEAWLEEMSMQGLHLQSAIPFGIYRFAAGQAQRYAYRLDFILRAKDRAEQMQRFLNNGWEHIGNLGSWLYYRKPIVPGGDVGLYPDRQARVQKYRRLLGSLTVLLLMGVVLLGGGSQNLNDVLNLLGFLMLVLFLIASLKIMQRIRQLEQG